VVRIAGCLESLRKSSHEGTKRLATKITKDTKRTPKAFVNFVSFVAKAFVAFVASVLADVGLPLCGNIRPSHVYR